MGFFISSASMPAPTAAEREELAITYAALVLHDDGLPITEANLNAILAAANIKFVSAYWPRIFAKLLEGKDSETLDDIIMGGGAAPAVGGGAAAGGAAAGGAAAEEEKKVEEEEEESDEDMGFGLFD